MSNRLLFGYGNDDFENLIIQNSIKFDLLDSIDDYEFYTQNSDLKIRKSDSDIITFDSNLNVIIHNDLSITGSIDSSNSLKLETSLLSTIWKSSDTWDNGNSRDINVVYQQDPYDKKLNFRGSSGNGNIDGNGILKLTGISPRVYLDHYLQNVEITGEYSRHEDGTNPTDTYSGLNIGFRTDIQGHGENPEDSHTYYCRLKHNQFIDIYKESNHTTGGSILAYVAFTWSVDTYYSFKFRVYNLTSNQIKIEIYIDDVLKLEYTDTDEYFYNSSGYTFIRNSNILNNCYESYKNITLKQIDNGNNLYDNIINRNIGLGITNPSMKLEVVGGIKSDIIKSKQFEIINLEDEPTSKSNKFYMYRNEIKFGNSLFVEGDQTTGIGMSITGNTNIYGTLHSYNDVDIDTDLNVDGNVIIDGDIDINNNNFVVDSSTGNVGIGTNSPNTRLHIEGADSASPPLVFISNTSEDWGGIRFGDSGAPTTQNFDLLYSSLNQDFKIRSDNLDNIMYFEYNNGYIGLGNNDPDSPIHLNNTPSRLMKLQRTGGSGDGCYFEMNNPDGTRFIMGCGGSGFTGTDASVCILGNWSDGDLDFRTNSSSKMTIKSSGNVGIGTNNPANMLDVENNQNASTEIRLTNTDSGASALAAIRLTGDGGAAIIGIRGTGFSGGNTMDIADTLQLKSAAGDIVIGTNSSNGINFYTNDVERMRILSTGNVGIGLTDPDEKLEVNGNIKCNKVIPSTSGQLLNSVYINNQTVINTIINLSASWEQIVYYTYTPKSSNSKILISFNTDFDFEGNNTDSFASRITCSGHESNGSYHISTIQQKRQYFLDADGGGTRSGVLFPITGVYNNNEGIVSIVIIVEAQRLTSDDNLNITTDNTFIIQEISA